MSSHRVVSLMVTGLAIATVTAVRPAPAEAAVPSGFTDQLVATIPLPTAIAFTPDGRMLVTTQPGRVRVVQNGILVTTPALDLATRVCSDRERGLLGIAVDPSFTSNGFVYLYYTFNKFGSCPYNTPSAPVNRVSRFHMTGNTLEPASELALIDNIHSPNGNHNAGDLRFGKDGFLYVSVGDGGCDYLGGSGCGGSNDAARDRHVLLGKILRITSSGGIPAGNPFTGAGTARCNVTGSTSPGTICQETFAWGLRNPFRMAFDPNPASTVFYINDVGQNTWEEIDRGQAGADFGWNVREGFCALGSTTNCGSPPAGMTNPIFAYGRSDGCQSITGGAFVPNGVWPATYDGAYLFSDYVCGRIFRLVPNGSGGFTRTDFATGLGSSSAVHLTFGPFGSTQALYYTTYAAGGQIRRISSTSGGNRAPTASLTASPTSGSTPLTVSFNGGGSTDPDGDPLTYLWTFGDGTSVVITSTAPTTHTYVAAGTYTASLQVRDSLGATSSPATRTITVSGNTAPSPTIISPESDATFSVGQTITLTGSAADSQDGQLPASALRWQVILHHGTHTHPFLGPITGNNRTFTAPAPEDLLAATNSYLEVILTATDSNGATATVQRNLQPRTVALTLATSPTERGVTVNGTPFTGPTTITSWAGWPLTISALDQWPWLFAAWSDGGVRTHQIVTPTTPTTYTATFVRGPVTIIPPTTITGPVRVLVPDVVSRIDATNLVIRNLGSSVSLSAAVSFDPTTMTATLQPTNALVPGGRYTVVVAPAGSTPPEYPNGSDVAETSASFRASLIEQERTAAARYYWRRNSAGAAHGSEYVTEKTRGASIYYTFTGTSITWFTIRGPDQGNAEVQIDGVSRGTFNNYRSSTLYRAQRSFTGLSSGTHTFRVIVLGQKDARSRDYSVAVDAFRPGSAAVDLNPAVRSVWRSQPTSGASGGRVDRSRLANCQVYFTFNGTGVTWYTMRGRDQGIARVYIDGVFKGSFDNYYGVVRVRGWSFQGLADGLHTLRIVVTGTKRSSSTNTYVNVDYFRVR